jgi:hypothetical protein
MKMSVRSLLGLIVIAIICFAPVWPGQSVFLGQGPVAGKHIGSSAKSEYVLVDGGVYLLHARVRHALVLLTFTEREVWTEQRIADLRRRHPEIDKNELWMPPPEMQSVPSQ